MPVQTLVSAYLSTTESAGGAVRLGVPSRPATAVGSNFMGSDLAGASAATPSREGAITAAIAPTALAAPFSATAAMPARIFASRSAELGGAWAAAGAAARAGCSAPPVPASCCCRRMREHVEYLRVRRRGDGDADSRPSGGAGRAIGAQRAYARWCASHAPRPTLVLARAEWRACVRRGIGASHSPAVFDRVVRASREALGNLGPSRPELSMHLKDDGVLLHARIAGARASQRRPTGVREGVPARAHGQQKQGGVYRSTHCDRGGRGRLRAC